MTALWHRRPVRHVVFGLIPLLVAGPIVIVLLAVRLAHESAPVAGLLWAYLDESGAPSWAAATALAAGVLLWLPTVAGSDPT